MTTVPYVSLDITDATAIDKIITELNPDLVTQCAAWMAVDMAEDDDKMKRLERSMPADTKNIAAVCKKMDCKDY